MKTLNELFNEISNTPYGRVKYNAKNWNDKRIYLTVLNESCYIYKNENDEFSVSGNARQKDIVMDWISHFIAEKVYLIGNGNGGYLDLGAAGEVISIDHWAITCFFTEGEAQSALTAEKNEIGSLADGFRVMEMDYSEFEELTN